MMLDEDQMHREKAGVEHKENRSRDDEKWPACERQIRGRGCGESNGALLKPNER